MKSNQGPSASQTSMLKKKKKDFETRRLIAEKCQTDSIFEYRQKLKEAMKASQEAEVKRLLEDKYRERTKMGDQYIDRFFGKPPLPGQKLVKFQRANFDEKVKNFKSSNLKAQRLKKRKQNELQNYDFAVKRSARSEVVLPEEAGFLEADAGEATADVSQAQMVESVDIQSAQKHFCLALKQFGPYTMDYSRNGRFLLIAGDRGHAAVVDWQPKSLKCEFNVKETIHDVSWFHNETMYAVAQRQWVYVYDNQGLELHCLKALDAPLQLQFLPYHFLLVASNSKGFLQYVDVSVGTSVAGIKTHRGRLAVMTQNKTNAIIHMGHARGTVTLWSPNCTDGPLVEILAHKAAVRSVAVDHSGNYMATSAIDRKVKIWDLRTYGCLHEFKVMAGAASLDFSDRGLLAAAIGSTVQVFKDVIQRPPEQVYIQHNAMGSIRRTRFCPYEDVLGVGSDSGFESLLIPGAGEPNFDALEANPYQSRKQRQSHEVKMLLDKIPAELITIKKDSLTEVRDPKAVVKSHAHLPKKPETKYTYIPSKSVLEQRRREKVKAALEETRKKVEKESKEQKAKKKAFNPLERFVSKD